ncbi:MAG: DUF4153 domain-containing protein [Alphaproteobacteria bacterium]
MNGTGNGAESGAMRLSVILAGLLGGLVFGGLVEFDEYLSDPQGGGLAAAVFIFTTAFALTAAPGRFTAATVFSVILALLIGGLSYKVRLFEEAHGAAPDDFINWFWFAIAAPATAYILTVFGLTAIEERAPRWPYGRVFQHLFGFPVQLLFALAVVALLNLLIWLWSELFEIIGIDVISEIWDEPLVWMPMSGAFAGLGVALAREWQGITAALRTMCRYVARFALPIFAAFTVTLLIALPVQGLEDLFGSQSAARIMAALAAFTIFLVYGARQDLADTPPGWLRIATAISVLGLPVYTALAAYAIWLRVSQYGFTPERYAGLVLVVILFLHAAGLLAVQALDLLRRRGWLAGAGPVNILVLAVLAGFFLAIHTPQLDPYEISAQSQFNRLADERADPAEFDYGYLRFKLGPAGERALERLKGLDSHPETGVIRERIALAEKAKNYWEWNSLRRGERPPEPAMPEGAPKRPESAPEGSGNGTKG